ncbi:DNA-binding transcriptional regulator [Ktedonosporobacter rubrisoli]|uniref:DNA-binding transcriptional regulator n=1 Tax=Ktedonosporobacter rubrisoli TaxID=2509675 RepID=A0A4P6JSM1_KTERU|nr:sugar-binding domain-containing protein [Ktedonosporobacter rubrisoli]QBD78250.1 DNA-binding transcriptional regulator [Ktedonosporobacter rubrisoli]
MPESIQSTSEARLLNDERFLRKIAYLYYEEGHSQETIASMEFCSRPTVSKALQRARDRGIVRIGIVPDVRTGYLRNLSREVRLQLGLEDLILVAGRNMNRVDGDELLEDVATDIAGAAAEYLDQMLNDADILAVSGGRTFMRNLVRYLKPTKVLPHMQVVASIGFVDSHTSFGDANLIAHDLAEAYGANHLWFPCPAFLPSQKDVELIRNLPIIKDAYEMMSRASVMVTSLWTPHTNQDMIKRGILSQAQVEAIETYRPVVDINHWVFDASGVCINEVLEPFPYTLSGLEIPRLKERIERGSVKVILVAGGSPSHVPAIKATLNAGLASIVVTDHITAQLLSVEN